MKKSLITIIMLITLISLNAQSLFEVKDASDNTVLEVSNDGLRIFNEGDTLMVISASEIRANLSNSKNRALSRSFAVTTSASGKGDSKMFEIGASDGAIFYNPTDNSDQILSINQNSIIANVNPALDRDFVINDEVSAKGSGNLMKISNEAVFETVDDSTMLWYKDKNAFRIGYVLITNPNNVGQGSFASGYQSQASGKFASALGKEAAASGEAAFASGSNAVASGVNSCAIGSDALASQSSAIALGSETEATGSSSCAIGYKAKASSATSFAAGNRTEASGSNSAAIGMWCHASGDYSMAFGSGLTLASGNYSTAIGSTVQATHDYSVAIGVGSLSRAPSAVSMGRINHADGTGSTAIGYRNEATGEYSTAIGRYTEATGNYSTAIGNYTNATGYISTALGNSTTATGSYSTALGNGTEARQYCSTAIGRYNTVGGSSTSWVSSDALFLIGNGSSSSSRSDAMKVKKNGEVYFPSVYYDTTSNSKKDLKIDSAGKLCVLSAKEQGYTDEDVVEVIENNKKLRSEVEVLRAEIEDIKKLLR